VGKCEAILIHFSGKEMDSKAVTITAPVNSLEAFLILVVNVCLHKRGFSVSDAAVASDTAQKIGLFLSLDVAVASDTENHCPCK
jgi:hypothetical protein